MTFFSSDKTVEGSGLLRANIAMLALLFTLLFLVAFIPDIYRDLANKALLSLIFIVSVCVLRTRVRLVLTLAIGLILVQLVAKTSGKHLVEVTAGLLNSTFFIYVIAKLIARFALANDVSPLVLLGAVNGYLLMGLVFAMGAGIISGIYPESYYLSHEGTFLSASSDLHVYIYHSFITMATVGYGDITPVSEAARGLAVLVSVCGQLYIAMVIAFLVGKFAGKSPTQLRQP